jgi:hypothetical protein
MANSYEWRVLGFEVLPESGSETNVVKSVLFKMYGTDGTHTVFAVKGGDAYPTGYGQADFPPPDPSHFKPFSQFTKNEIDAWLDANISEQDQIAMRASIDLQIQELQNPPVVELAPPWSADS